MELISSMTLTHDNILQFCDKVKKLQKDHSIPNFALSIIHPSNNVILVGGRETNKQTLFPIGSMSKAFAATLIGILADKGLINWNDSIYKFVDITLPNDLDLTIYQLLSHINPFPEHTLTEASELGFSRSELIAKLQHIKVDKRIKFSYQNVLFSLVADIIEKVTGKSYADYLQQEIFIPLGMLSTTASEKNYLRTQNKALPHMRCEGNITAIPYSPYWHIMGPPSCVSSSILDLTQWIKFNLQMVHNNLISKESLHKIQYPLKTSHPPYAMGWWKADKKGKVLCHTGSVTGFDSVIAMIPSCNTGIIICANLLGDPFVYKLVNDFIKQVLNEKTFNCTSIFKPQKSLARLTLQAKPTLSINKCIGTFYHPILETIKVSVKDNQLLVKLGKNNSIGKLSPITLSVRHSKMTSELSQLASHQCFQVHWQNGMEAAGKMYYNEDIIAFAQNKAGDVDTLHLFAEAISHASLLCKRFTMLESKNFPDNKSEYNVRKKGTTMARSQKQLTIDSKNTKVAKEIAAPVDVINTMLGYDDFDPVNSHGMMPLVSTLFNSIKTQKVCAIKGVDNNHCRRQSR